PPARARRAILFAAKAAVSGLAMALAFSQVDWQEVGRILSGVDLAFAAACLSARVLLMGLNAWKLVFLLKPSTIAPGLVFRLNFMKALFNNLLPGGVGGEGVRMLLLGKETGSLGRASAAVIADRLTGLWMQVIFTSVSVPFLPVLGGPWTRFLAAAATGMLGLSAGLLALGPGPRLVGAALRRFPGRGADLLAAEAGNFRAFFHGLPAGPGRIAGLVAYCLASQVLLMVVLYLGARALGGSLIPAQIAPILLATALASLVPFTLGGLGVAEGASALAFSLAGSTAELGLLTALLMRALGMVPALIGAVLFLLTGLL
ncbi:MAG TPA: lysylphosphatidylglycerol synthase transmembrane domain-containing protein, partial [Fibrobacteria bacterium]|nr:lysylphosphatidylglycerol synthase transmembrane domain-containing protein [Fibrobacteria bacterium]